MNMIRIGLVAAFLLPVCVAQAQEKGMIVAHRGGAGEFDGNTLGAFKASYEKGIRGFETDIRMTKNGVLVILHDDTLERTYGVTGRVEEMTAQQLRPLKTMKAGELFLFLDQLLEYFADKPGVYFEFEMKTSDAKLYPEARLEQYCKAIHPAVTGRRPNGSTYIFTSFDDRPLKIIRQLDPKAERLLIVDGPCDEQVVQQAQELGLKRVSCRLEKMSRVGVRLAQKGGLKVTGWTGKTLADYLLGLGLGVDVFCTDIPVAINTWKAENPRPLVRKKQP